MRPFFPALLVALFAGWCGTLGWGGTAAASAVGTLVLLGTVVAGAPSRRELCDPLGLAPAGSPGGWTWLGLLPWAIWGWCLLSAALSPVPRSGRMALVLLPAFLLLPGLVARCLATEREARLAARALALVGAALSLWALADWLLLGSPRPAMPLGHHNLLALVLVALLPLAALPAREEGGWRWAGWCALALIAGTVMVSRSLAGVASLLVQTVIWFVFSHAPRGRGSAEKEPDRSSEAGSARRGAKEGERRRRVLAAPALPILLLLTAALGFGGRILRVAAGVDPSLQARGVYWRAGIAGAAAHPLVGWGPGSTPWTLAAFLDPIPGVTPPGEEVGELHDLPLALAYELGLPGALLILAVGVLFLRARWRESKGPFPEGPGESVIALGRAGLLAAIGAGVAFLGSAALGVTALPVVLAVGVGFSLAPSRSSDRDPARRPLPRIGLSYAGVALVAVVPCLLAQLHYDRAKGAGARGDRQTVLHELSRAVALDKSFPLYRWRLALEEIRGAPVEGTDRAAAIAGQALRAAQEARGIPALWESAGIVGTWARLPWAPLALARASDLDPTLALAPFWLAAGGLEKPDRDLEPPARWRTRSEYGALALLGHPKLLGACAWQREPELLDGALAELLRWPGIDAGWKEAILEEARRRQGKEEPPTRELAPTYDREEASSVSLHLFHRRGWPVRGPGVPLCGPDFSADLPPVWLLPTTTPAVLRVKNANSRSLRGQDLLR